MADRKAFSRETAQENAEERVEHGGPGLELFRRACVTRLREQMDAFYEHASTGDLCALYIAMSEAERTENLAITRDHAALLESILDTLDIDPNRLLRRMRNVKARW